MKKVLLLFMTAILLCGALIPNTACSRVEMIYDSSTKYGIYWFGEDNYDFVRSSSDMDIKYFDPSKPTFVFAHGWEPDKKNSSNGLFEDFVTHKETVSKTGTEDIRDYAKLLKEQGYNVACLSWFSYANSLAHLFNYIWLSFDGGDALSVRFAMELALVLGENYDGDVKMVGHSYGSQLALATTYQLVHLQKQKAFKNNHIIPTRMTLADPYFGATILISNWKSIKNSNISFTNEPLNAREPSKLFADVTEFVVKQKDIAIDMYFGMSMASTAYYKYDGSDPYFEKLLQNSTIVKSRGLESRYGDLNIHNIVRDWTLLSIVDGVKMYDQNGDIAPSGAANNKDIKAMRGKCYNQVYEGLNLRQDSMVLVDRSIIEF